MRRINEILAVVILSLLAVLLAAIGLRSYDTFVTRREQERILARNQEANDRVQEMRQEIQELSQDRERLVLFLEEIQIESAVVEEAVPVAAMFDEERESLSGDESWSENTTVSENGSWSENTTVSGNGSWSENTMVSGNTIVSDNGTISGNTLEERRKIRSSLEETLLVNQEDRLCLEQSLPDFSGKKIACLGDSITAAANLEEQENYPDCSYPSILKELLGAEEVYNLGIGGSSIGRYWSDAFVDRYQEIPSDTDIILVMGGTNDGFCLSEKEFGTLEERKPWTFCGDLDELMRGLQED
ncbi:MAG: SGNH/GDSL hydrolase family protein, partial [Lachnospiraceae bacterium]|nr:SGNH/GDSL hydrolase family protein [Lachnospiraceae bacterium]